MSKVIFSALYKCVLKRSTYQFVLYSTQAERVDLKPVSKVVNVAIIGAPNSGKSTLINNIVGRKICASSSKVHTTTKLARAFCFQDDTQIVFLDTPGVVTEKEMKKYSLPQSMLNACYKSLNCADVIGVLHDVSNRHLKDVLHKDVITMLASAPKVPTFLMLNKIDMLNSKKQLLHLIHNLSNGIIAGKPIPGAMRNKRDKYNDKIEPLKGYSKFSDVFLISALNGDGVADIKKYLLANAKPAKYQYSPEIWSDQKPESLIVETVRATFLNFLHQEIPYNLTIEIELYEEIQEDNKIVCSVKVECPSERLCKLIGGAGGGRLHQIQTSARNDLTELFQRPVSLHLEMTAKYAKITTSK